MRNEVLNAAIVPVRRHIRANGGTFVGKEGAEKVKAILDALAKELNAPRFGKADEILATLGMEVENKLCIVLGVDAYNAFVKEYNGK